MMMVKCENRPSKIHGFGVFALERIKRGTVTWRQHDLVDFPITETDLQALPEQAREFIWATSYTLASEPGIHRHCMDHGMFMNHCVRANCEYQPDRLLDIAVMDIAVGEEITTNYYLYNTKYPPGHFERSLGAELASA